MDNNMFNEKKQGIIDRIDAAASYALDFNADMDDEQIAIQTNSVSIRLGQAIDAVKELQPPSPPKCVTCDYYLTDELLLNFGGGLCDKKIIQYTNCAFMMVKPDFGCTKHSDYEAAK